MRSVPPAFWAATGSTLANKSAPDRALVLAPTPRLNNAILRLRIGNPCLLWSLVERNACPECRPLATWPRTAPSLRQPQFAPTSPTRAAGGALGAGVAHSPSPGKNRQSGYRPGRMTGELGAPRVPGQRLGLAPAHTDLRRGFGLFFFG